MSRFLRRLFAKNISIFTFSMITYLRLHFIFPIYTLNYIWEILTLLAGRTLNLWKTSAISDGVGPNSIFLIDFDNLEAETFDTTKDTLSFDVTFSSCR